MTLILVIVALLLLVTSLVAAISIKAASEAWCENRRLKEEVKRLTPPDGSFAFNWGRENLADDLFKDIVNWLNEPGREGFNWYANMDDHGAAWSHRRNEIQVRTEDAQQAMLFKLTFSGT